MEKASYNSNTVQDRPTNHLWYLDICLCLVYPHQTNMILILVDSAYFWGTDLAYPTILSPLFYIVLSVNLLFNICQKGMQTISGNVLEKKESTLYNNFNVNLQSLYSQYSNPCLWWYMNMAIMNLHGMEHHKCNYAPWVCDCIDMLQ